MVLSLLLEEIKIGICLIYSPLQKKITTKPFQLQLKKKQNNLYYSLKEKSIPSTAGICTNSMNYFGTKLVLSFFPQISIFCCCCCVGFVFGSMKFIEYTHLFFINTICQNFLQSQKDVWVENFLSPIGILQEAKKQLTPRFLFPKFCVQQWKSADPTHVKKCLGRQWSQKRREAESWLFYNTDPFSHSLVVVTPA